MIETALAVRFPAGANFCYSSALSYHRPAWTSEDVTSVGHASSFCRVLHSCTSDVHWKRCQRLNSRSLLGRNNLRKNGIQASAEPLGSASDPIKQNRGLQYHPSEELVKSITEIAEDVRPTSAETTRTIIEEGCLHYCFMHQQMLPLEGTHLFESYILFPSCSRGLKWRSKTENRPSSTNLHRACSEIYI